MEECHDVFGQIEECWDEGSCGGCEKWDESCCDWAPCSWVCDVIVRGACLICTWIEKIVCVLYYGFIGVACTVIDLATAVLGALVAVIEAALNWAWSIVGFIWGILTSIPGLGRLLSWAHATAVEIFNLVISIPDMILGLVGIVPEKKLRLGVIVLKQRDGTPVVSDDIILRAIQCAIICFKEEANVRVIPIRYAQYQNPWSDQQRASKAYIFHDDAPSSDRLLDVCCDACALGESLGPVGADFNMKMYRHTFWGNGRRLLGWGAPVVAFAVRSFKNREGGCSIAWLSDWVTVVFQQSDTDPPGINVPGVSDAIIPADDLNPSQRLGRIADLAHEMAHACDLPHDLLGKTMGWMKRSPPRFMQLTAWQRIALRGSRHVTFF